MIRAFPIVFRLFVSALVCCTLVGAPATAGTLTTFPAGTFIVPMQTTYRLVQGDVLLAHGMLYHLLQRPGMMAYRAIDGDKAGVDVRDFAVRDVAGVRVVVDYHGSTAPDGNIVSYLGGAWLIPPQYKDDLDATLADPAWAGVQVHRATVAFTAPAVAVHQLSSQPIAVLVSADPTEADRVRAAMEWFLTPAGLDGAFATITPDDIVNGALLSPDAPALLLLPYAQPLREAGAAIASEVLQRLHMWLVAGGKALVAQDDAVVFLENQAAGRFLTTSGVGINGVIHQDRSRNRAPAGALQLSPEPGHMLAQIGDHGEFASYCAESRPCVPATDGLARNFRPFQAGDATLAGYGAPEVGSTYRSTVRHLHTWDADGSGYQWDLAVIGRIGGWWANSAVVYLGGRVIPDAASAEGSTFPEISTALRRVFLNSLFLVGEAAPALQVVHAGVTVDRDLIEFRGSTNVADGRGHLEAFDAAIDRTTPLWDAVNQIPADNNRRIFTHDGGVIKQVVAGDAFIKGVLSREEIERLRGRRGNAMGTFDNLANRLGAIDHSTAVAVGSSARVDGAGARARSVYVGTLDGLLEAVDANPAADAAAGTGIEQWAMVPRCQIDRLAADGVDAVLGVDGSPTVADLWIDHDGNDTTPRTFRTVLTVPMGASSPHILALDISDRDNPRVLWELTDHTPVDMGFATKTAMGHIARNDGTGNLVRTAVVWVATSKYRQTGGGGLSLYCFRAEDGAKLWSFHQTYPSGVNDVPPPIVAVDPDGDGFVETVLAGDNVGRLWAIDARSGKSRYCNDLPSFCDDPIPLYPANDGSDPARPIGAAPAVVAEGGQMIVLFGTGGYDWAPAETDPQRFVALLVPDHGNAIELFHIDGGPGDRFYASPVVDRDAHYLFLGKSHGRAGSGAIPADDGASATVQSYDISGALDGTQGDPAAVGDAVVVAGQALPGGLQLQNGVLFGATAGAGTVQIGDAGAAEAQPRPEPLGRLYWRVVP